ncbi:MAG: ferrous iron transporter B, partial [Candidatus Omnitrophica bacterium]|nr:ferrous iron transporter B [Candidatus Omnitrophota bacterium]
MIKRIYLVGNPNVGKSVVFSRLTGVKVVSSNYPGTTVEITRGYLKVGEEKIEVVDLPGTYSLEPASKAEEVAVKLLKEYPTEEFIVINIVDATNLERNLYLTLQLIEERFQIIVCLNMCDDIKHRGIEIDTEKLEELLAVPVVPTCAVTGFGIKHLIEKIGLARTASRQRTTHQQRWQQIGKILESVQHLTHRHHTLREMLEDASIRPFSGLFIAAGVIYASFRIIRFLGEFLINRVFDPLFLNLYQPFLERISHSWDKQGFLHYLLVGELIQGKIDFRQSLGLLTTAPYIELVMVLPYVFSFYLVLNILEDLGYLPRLALLLDNLLHRLGLHGFSIIPVLLGFGCNVPGILATRVLESKRERFIASVLISIGVPCVALQAMIFGLLGKFSGFYVAGVYLVLFSLWIILGTVLNFILKGFSPELLLEIPPYRFPLINILLQKIILRIRGFLMEALPVVFLGVLVVNVLLWFRLFDFIGKIFSPIISGLFGLPQRAVIALLIGFIRKDVAVGMLAPLSLSAKQIFIATVLL